jgi:hypothetical protein
MGLSALPFIDPFLRGSQCCAQGERAGLLVLGHPFNSSCAKTSRDGGGAEVIIVPAPMLLRRESIGDQLFLLR